MNQDPNPGLIVVVSAPSGVGKTTICQEIVRRNVDCVFSVSVTTRPRRKGERDGRDYYFVSTAEFQQRVQQGQLAEWAVVHGHHYGTMKTALAEITGRGDTAILDIDVQGGIQIKAHYPEAVMVFLLPPSFKVLRARLEGRQTEGSEQIEQRITHARTELQKATAYSYLIVNDDLAEAVNDFQSILKAERCRLERNRFLLNRFDDGT